MDTPPGNRVPLPGGIKTRPLPGRPVPRSSSATSTVGLFYRLHELTPGQTITVTRSDQVAAVFTVDKVDVYHKAAFPTVEVFRNADRPEVRLITCGGYYFSTGEYLDNTVVYAHLTSTHPA
ncbi:sortase [Arthrobacter sp. UYCu512]|uniref:sortase domain-containing protein n=1 Tax=Arthrobacter sp. UYCu512 TaxID=3156338 RepID=UPI00339B7BF3